MTASRLLRARVELVHEAIDRLGGLEPAWSALVAAHALRADRPSSAAIADAFGGPAAGVDDLLDGLTLTQISVLYESSLAHVDHRSRKSSGQYFTPDDVARFLAERAAGFPPGVWIDPCTGVGNLAHALAAAQPDPAAFVAEHLVLVDRDPLALRIAVALLSLEFEAERSVWPALRDRARVADALADPLPDYDFAILNPPYVQVPRDDRFAVAEARDLYAYFLERMLRDGRGLVAITPQSYTSGRRYAPLRRLLVRECAELDVYCFDNVPDTVFRGVKFGSQNSNRVNSTRAAILVARRHPEGTPHRHRITPLLRWRAHERATLLATADEFLAPLQPDADRAFPKVGADLVDLHRALAATEQTVGDLLADEPTAFHLDVPITPRYFLTAARRELDRGHRIRLHFVTAADRDRAAVVLNSSLAHWWWRVYEGGITVSRTTLLGIPVPLDAAPPHLLADLERSERDNVVVKVNAGLRNENVKHPWWLLRRLNAAVAPDHVDALMGTHANSDLPARPDADAAVRDAAAG